MGVVCYKFQMRKPSKDSPNEFVYDPVHRVMRLRRDFYVVRPGDTAQSIAAEREAKLNETVRWCREREERMRAEWIAAGLDPAVLDQPMFGSPRFLPDDDPEG